MQMSSTEKNHGNHVLLPTGKYSTGHISYFNYCLKRKKGFYNRRDETLLRRLVSKVEESKHIA